MKNSLDSRYKSTLYVIFEFVLEKSYFRKSQHHDSDPYVRQTRRDSKYLS